jgi:hypothetical protein
VIYDGGLQFSGSRRPRLNRQSDDRHDLFELPIDLGPGLRDIGIGDDPAVKFAVTVVQPFSGGTSLQVAVQGSVDNTTFVTMALGPTIAEANLIAGAHLLDIDMPRIIGAMVSGAGPSQALSRYIRLACINQGVHSQGSVFSGAILDRGDQIVSYPVAITVPN